MSTNMSTAIDRLGELKAQIADLQREEKALKAIMTEIGPGAYEGDLFRVTVSSFERETLDMEAVRAKLSPQFIRAHTTVTPVTAVRVTSRNTRDLAVAA